jgi:RNA polymerase sigma factor (sigma-70 family)
MDDSELIAQYVTTGSEAAFAQLVNRHIDLVYAAARRQSRDVHDTEDITQSAFIVLARKACKLPRKTNLSAWLLTTTRYIAWNVRSAAARRQHHEQRAAAMANTTETRAAPVVEPVEPLLDQALSRLGTRDRNAVALRYLQGKSVAEVAAAMGVSTGAAQRRVNRAIEKLRGYFRRRNIPLDSAACAAALARQSALLAPPALAARVATQSLATGAAAAGPCALLADAAIRSLAWMQAQLIASAVAVVLIVGGVGAVVLSPRQSAVATPASAPSIGVAPVLLRASDIWMPYVPSDTPGTEVLHIANAALEPASRPSHFTGIDPTVRRSLLAQPAATVRSLPAISGQGRSFLTATVSAEPYRGKRVRFAAWLKSDGVEDIGFISMGIYRSETDLYVHDEMDGHELIGTHDWQRFDIVSDVPPDATKILLRTMLVGKGTLWSDGYELAVVGNEVPTHDDHGWRTCGNAQRKFTSRLDRGTLHQGQPTICLSSKTAKPTEWVAYAQTNHDAEEYLGKRVRLSVTMKCDSAGQAVGPFIRAVGPHDSALRNDEQAGRRPRRANTDWKTYSTELTVPQESMGICIGVVLFGKGTVWFDDITLEVVSER